MTHRAPRALVALLLLTLAACASDPPPVPDPTPTAEAPEARGDDQALAECEELFQTVVGIDPGGEPEMVKVAAQSARSRAEPCREIFLASSNTDGARLVANAFGDVLHIRAFEFEMATKSRAGDASNICGPTKDNIERAKKLRETLGNALAKDSGVELAEAERGVLEQIHDMAAFQVNGLEPFYLRGCKNGRFQPELFITVDDLTAEPTMSEAGCREILVAFAAFDLEQAANDQTAALIELLREATSPCQAALTKDNASETVGDLERHSVAELIESGPVLLGASVALAAGEQDQACGAMKAYLDLADKRIVRLQAVVTKADLPTDVRLYAGTELDVADSTRRSLLSDYSSLCSL